MRLLGSFNAKIKLFRGRSQELLTKGFLIPHCELICVSPLKSTDLLQGLDQRKILIIKGIVK